MGWHRVCLNTIVRKEKVLDSERLRILPMGSRVNVVEKQGRRVRIDQPISGWCSLNSSNGDTILKPLDANQTSKMVAPTPRSGQAAVTNLTEKVKYTEEQISKAQDSEKELLKQEKLQYEARIKDLEKKDAERQKMLAALQAQSEKPTAQGTASTDIETVKFRAGDAAMIVPDHELKGICIIQCVVTVDGKEMIGCDYATPPDQFNFKGKSDGTHPVSGDKIWTPNQGMSGCWLERKDLKSLLPCLALLKQCEKLDQENTDLKYYKRTAEGMVKRVQEFHDQFKNNHTITFRPNADETGAKTLKGEDFAKAFLTQFTSIEIHD